MIPPPLCPAKGGVATAQEDKGYVDAVRGDAGIRVAMAPPLAEPTEVVG